MHCSDYPALGWTVLRTQSMKTASCVISTWMLAPCSWAPSFQGSAPGEGEASCTPIGGRDMPSVPVASDCPKSLQATAWRRFAELHYRALAVMHCHSWRLCSNVELSWLFGECLQDLQVSHSHTFITISNPWRMAVVYHTVLTNYRNWRIANSCCYQQIPTSARVYHTSASCISCIQTESKTTAPSKQEGVIPTLWSESLLCKEQQREWSHWNVANPTLWTWYPVPKLGSERSKRAYKDNIIISSLISKGGEDHTSTIEVQKTWRNFDKPTLSPCNKKMPHPDLSYALRATTAWAWAKATFFIASAYGVDSATARFIISNQTLFVINSQDNIYMLFHAFHCNCSWIKHAHWTVNIDNTTSNKYLDTVTFAWCNAPLFHGSTFKHTFLKFSRNWNDTRHPLSLNHTMQNNPRVHQLEHSWIAYTQAPALPLESFGIIGTETSAWHVVKSLTAHAT